MAELAQSSVALKSAQHLHAHPWPGLYMFYPFAHHGDVPQKHQQGKEQGGIERPAEEYLDALR